MYTPRKTQGGEVRGQVIQPGPRVGGLVVGFSRATSGISANL